MLGMDGGTRNRGRPRARWLDDIKSIAKCTPTELRGSTSDRNVWRRIMIISRTRMRLNEQANKVGGFARLNKIPKIQNKTG